MTGNSNECDFENLIRLDVRLFSWGAQHQAVCRQARSELYARLTLVKLNLINRKSRS